METLNKCILNYRQPESAVFIEVVGEPERTGKKEMWERPGGCGRRRKGRPGGAGGGKGGLEVGRRVQTEREYGRRKKRRKKYLSVRRTQGEETC